LLCRNGSDVRLDSAAQFLKLSVLNRLLLLCQIDSALDLAALFCEGIELLALLFRLQL
jgi:hypothetical protein